MPTVKFYASLRKVTGEREAQIQAGSVKEVLQRLSTDYDGELRRYLKISSILVNGKNVIHMKGKRTRLKPDDVVSIFPPLGGG
ncbi:MAG: MoaD family protein [Actinobacteria bacterium]|nr:MoaD family protein [Actinomycetota bacterium]MCG2818672.1 MoaD family protein [Actinomycetes bacterium]MBU4218138.1 MoaD family protein [Actinomycetota bacterium]MBU4358563.1 MoaD family protein [Actinomycetota bacterium]MBU4392120.1 MoaD family protein [Actinomycetota bacterium]